MPSPTYRIRLERESDGKTIYQWSRITRRQLAPLLRTLDAVVPMLAGLANAKRSLTNLLTGVR